MAAADAAAAVMEAMVEADVMEWQRWSRRMAEVLRRWWRGAGRRLRWPQRVWPEMKEVAGDGGGGRMEELTCGNPEATIATR
jgi:hypothetical protein